MCLKAVLNNDKLCEKIVPLLRGILSFEDFPCNFRYSCISCCAFAALPVLRYKAARPKCACAAGELSRSII
jgi:hypothetical protein